MTQDELTQSLDYVNATRKKRMQMANLVLDSPEIVSPLFKIAFKGQDPISYKACWILEYVAKQNLDLLLPYIDLFTQNIRNLNLDSSVRPMAKICEFLTKAYFSKKMNKVKTTLTHGHLELMSIACFDWLIGDYKVAAKAYAMTSLLLLGHKFDWIHPELKLVLEQNYASGSAAYKARSRMILEKLKSM
ncbi:MAG: adenylosuccinate lyase, partial [Maribacter sp.]|uniref:adenylosuccinate lyase n=1 Tax=Maribacter sp. TaxID=1897614 RepID=UPI003C72BE58